MPRKSKIKPKLKVGQCVRLSAGSRRYAHYAEHGLAGKVFRISAMNYHEEFETNPSPWSLVFEGVNPTEEWNIFEEDVILDPFMTAASRAVEGTDAT